jgi:endo-1,4-beta-xylanase
VDRRRCSHRWHWFVSSRSTNISFHPTDYFQGSQSHLSSSSGTADALKALAAVAPEVAITELDIAGASAADYQAVTQACLDLDNCVGITVWGAYLEAPLPFFQSANVVPGVSDAQSWRPDENPLLFDGSFQPKEAYTSLATFLSS